MANRSIALGKDVINRPKTARKRLMRELKRDRGNVTWASERLGVGRITMRRWINRLDLGDFVDELRETWRGMDRREASC